MIIVVNRVVATQAFDEEGDLVNPDKLHEARGIDAAIFVGEEI